MRMEMLVSVEILIHWSCIKCVFTYLNPIIYPEKREKNNLSGGVMR